MPFVCFYCFRNFVDDQSPLKFVVCWILLTKNLLSAFDSVCHCCGEQESTVQLMHGLRKGQVLGERLSERVSQISAG